MATNSSRDLRHYAGAAGIFALVIALLLFLSFYQIPKDNKDIFVSIVGMIVGSLSVVIYAIIGRNPDNPKDRTPGLPTKQMLEINNNPQITNTLTTVEKDNMVVQPCYQDIEIGDIRYDEGGFRPRKNGIAPALVGSNDKSGTPNCSILKINETHNEGVVDPIVHGAITQAIGRGGSSSEYLNSVKSINEAQPNYQIRRLTPIECERLQGFPDNHTAVGVYDGETKPISNTQRYKMCGNAVTVDVVHAIAKQITKIL